MYLLSFVSLETNQDNRPYKKFRVWRWKNENQFDLPCLLTKSNLIFIIFYGLLECPVRNTQRVYFSEIVDIHFEIFNWVKHAFAPQKA